MSMNLHSAIASTDEKLERLNNNLQALIAKSKSLNAANIVAMKNQGDEDTVVVLSDDSGCHIWSLCFTATGSVYIADAQDRFLSVIVDTAALIAGGLVLTSGKNAIRAAQKRAQESSTVPVFKVLSVLKAAYKAAAQIH